MNNCGFKQIKYIIILIVITLQEEAELESEAVTRKLRIGIGLGIKAPPPESNSSREKLGDSHPPPSALAAAQGECCLQWSSWQDIGQNWSDRHAVWLLNIPWPSESL